MRTIAISLGVFLACAGLGRAATIDLSTGLDAYGNVIASSGVADANWTVGQPGGGTAAAKTVFPDSPDWGPGTGESNEWVANDGNSDWIARDASLLNQGAGTYSFYRQFDLTGYDLSTVFINGGWAADDDGDLRINGYLIASLQYHPSTGGVADNWNHLHSFAVANPAWLNQGLNTLTITLVDTCGVMDGARLSGTLTTVPEPSSFVLFAIAAISFLGYARRRRAA
jgi:hypothetical protein